MGGFQPPCPLRYTNFDNHLQIRVPLWEPKSAPSRFQNLSQAKFLRIVAFKRVRTTSFKVALLSTQRDPLGLQILPWGKVRVKVQSFSIKNSIIKVVINLK